MPKQPELSGVFLGKSKDSLDAVELSVPLDMAVQSFGCSLHYHVNSSRGASSHGVDAFELTMFSQTQQLRKFPRKKEPPQNQKDKLFNDLIDLLEVKQLFYSLAESSGHSLVKVLTDLLWHIDGHHATFSDQSCAIPLVFANFIGYNVSERSKHRKRWQICLPTH